MKEKLVRLPYEAAEVDISLFCERDVIATSGVLNVGGESDGNLPSDQWTPPRW